ncbi:hypothetical protein K402DRAFT_458553 [Aulographum hederae CBS 113979]|uniref:Uncharacterized protein n=1 Tax=Aulographum hederae CBS 113979 TaxID=1176131 RepID=A0A6G1GIR4_9PEZI|nr:hypothetical protein K402DRAFT_458553 [Aulographum hederae CBS 113979]
MKFLPAPVMVLAISLAVVKALPTIGNQARYTNISTPGPVYTQCRSSPSKPSSPSPCQILTTSSTLTTPLPPEVTYADATSMATEIFNKKDSQCCSRTNGTCVNWACRSSGCVNGCSVDKLQACNPCNEAALNLLRVINNCKMDGRVGGKVGRSGNRLVVDI